MSLRMNKHTEFLASTHTHIFSFLVMYAVILTSVLLVRVMYAVMSFWLLFYRSVFHFTELRERRGKTQDFFFLLHSSSCCKTSQSETFLAHTISFLFFVFYREFSERIQEIRKINKEKEMDMGKSGDGFFFW